MVIVGFSKLGLGMRSGCGVKMELEALEELDEEVEEELETEDEVEVEVVKTRGASQTKARA